jgi:hypothetical protein
MTRLCCQRPFISASTSRPHRLMRPLTPLRMILLRFFATKAPAPTTDTMWPRREERRRHPLPVTCLHLLCPPRLLLYPVVQAAISAAAVPAAQVPAAAVAATSIQSSHHFGGGVSMTIVSTSCRRVRRRARRRAHLTRKMRDIQHLSPPPLLRQLFTVST